MAATNMTAQTLDMSGHVRNGLGKYVSDLPGGAADPTTLPLATKSTITAAYSGSFKVDFTDGVSSTDYGYGRVAYNPANDSVFIDSHVYQLAVAEFAIPATLSTSIDKSLLPNATSLQGFSTVLERTDTGNTSGFDRLGGMDFINGELFVQSYLTYDTGSSPFTTLIVRDTDNLPTSNIDGFFSMAGAARTVNYLSPIPAEWQTLLGGDYIAGNGSGMSIDSRCSMGPSLYAFSSSDFSGTGGAIAATAHMNYPVDNALSSTLYIDNTTEGYVNWDLYNKTTNNDMWTAWSVAGFGFVVPGTRTFAVFGRSGMHASGGGYKITNNQGYTYAGAGAQDAEDVHSYYWLYDLNEILAATNEYDPLPYEYGIFDDRFTAYSTQGGEGIQTGGAFDPVSGKLVLSHKAGTSNHESGHPVISVYEFGV